MCNRLAKRLRDNKKVCNIVSFGIGYSKNTGGGFHHSRKLSESTASENIIYESCMCIFNNFIEDLPIRKVSIALGGLENNNYVQLNLFEENETIVKEDKMNTVIDSITKKFGDNSLLKASSLIEYSTIKKRNNTLGGHNKY